jgi:hypothetical protein
MNLKRIIIMCLKRIIPFKIRQYIIKYIYNLQGFIKLYGSPHNLFIIFHQKCSKFITPKNINFLSWDIPKLLTKEYHAANDFYFHALCLKKYCGLNYNYQLKCVVEHAAFLGDYAWEVDLNSNLPGMIFMGNNRIETLKKTNKKLFPIGPYIAYSINLLSENQLNSERRRLGKNLLFFPTHSTHNIMADYDVNQTCEVIKSYSKSFDTVRICLYWQDILRGYHLAYKKYGFECVCAGHIYDEYFLPRLKSIISVSSMTMSNKVGTFVGYCIYMNKPHCIINDEVNYLTNNEYEKNLLELEQRANENIYDLFNKTFSNFNESITDEQYKLVDKYWGISNIKTKDELKNIFEICDNLFKLNK